MQEHTKQSDMLEKMRDVLGEEYVVLKIVGYQLDEDFETSVARIHCKLVEESTHNVTTIEGKGSGLVDACFHGLMGTLAETYPSLRTITFQDFLVKGIMATGEATALADAEAQVELTVASTEGYTFTFCATSRSLGRASIEATLQAVSYFVNSEKAFIRIYNILKHYREKGRTDLVTKYQLLLSQMVQNTSYTEVIEQIKTHELQAKQ